MLPEYIEGGIHSDSRGTLRFCNDFDMAAVKRFYTVSNSAEQPVRGWIGHKKENKWFFPLKGTTVIAVEPMSENHVEHAQTCRDEDSTRSTRSTRLVYTLVESNPSILKIPGGHWFCIEQHDGAEVMVFSDCKVGEYENDDLRKPLTM